MKHIKWLWISTLVVVIIYSIYDYMDNGFNWRTIINLVIVICSGVGFLSKK